MHGQEGLAALVAEAKGKGLRFERWQRGDIAGERGTIRTVPQNYYVCSVRADGHLEWHPEIEPVTRDIDRRYVQAWWGQLAGLEEEKMQGMKRGIFTRLRGEVGCPYCGDTSQTSPQKIVGESVPYGHYIQNGVTHWLVILILACGHMVEKAESNLGPGYTFPGS